MSERALDVSGLTVSYRRSDGSENAVVWKADFVLERGRVLGLAGESGCGKSTLALAALGYRASGASISSGTAVLGGELDLLALPTRGLRSIWGKRVAYVAQSSATALNPATTIGKQLAEPLVLHCGLRGPELAQRQLELLEQIGLPEARRALKRYPHEFSGGQQQRIAIAIALSCRPEVLILDEPTTGLDVTTQARISELLRSLLREAGTATLYVSHDVGLLSTIADRLAVMYAGEVVEEAPAREVIGEPRHPYTRALLAAVPSVESRRGVAGIPGHPPASVIVDACAFTSRCSFSTDVCRRASPALEQVGGHNVRCFHWRELAATEVRTPAFELPTLNAGSLLEVTDLVCAYHKADHPAVDHVSFRVAAGETLGIVGESGSGKSTMLRGIAGLHPRSGGDILLAGDRLEPRASDRSRASLRAVQLVFQDPGSSLNPRQTVAEALGRTLRLREGKGARSVHKDEAAALISAVKLPAEMLQRYPGELSGGQAQRVALARAFAARPQLLLCDEVTSALDVSVQASILDLLMEMARDSGTAVVFVTHDLAVVRTITSRALVLKDGRLCEEGTTEQLFSHARHPYTRELIAAIPRIGAQGRPTAAVGKSPTT